MGFHSFIPSPPSQHYKTFLLYRAFHCFISLRLSLLIQYHLGHSFAASQPLSVDQFSDHFSSTITAKSSTFIPYIGPVIINGILYTPSEPLTPKDSQSLKEVDHPQEVLQPEVKSSSHSQSFVPAPTRDIQTQTDFPIYNPVLVILPSAAIMPGPQFGALGATFTVVRAMQFVSLIAIIGMTSNFIDQMVKLDQKPPSVLIGTLSVTVITVLYVLISYVLYWDSMLPFLISPALDSTILIAVIVVAVTVGKPLSYLDCAALSNSGGSTSSFLASVGENMSKVNYWVWAGASKTTCFELKSIWGLSIALCILFAFSSVVSICLWRKLKVVGPAKDIEN